MAFLQTESVEMKKGMMWTFCLTTLVFGGFFLPVAQAAPVVEFNRASYSSLSGKGAGETGQVAVPATANSQVKASGLWRGGVTPSFCGTEGGSVFWRADGTEDDEKGSVSGSDYLVFSVNVDSGYKLNLSSLSFQMGGSDPQSTGAFLATVYAQIDTGSGFATVGSQAVEIAKKAPNTNVKQGTLTVDLSASEYQGLTGTVTFRIGVYDTANSASQYVRGQDIILEGNVVPAQ